MVATMSRIGPTRGRSISSRSSCEDERGELTAGEAEPAAQPHVHPVGRRGPVERARDRRPPVDHHRITGCVPDVPAADVENLEALVGPPAERSLRPERVVVAVDAPEERRSFRLGGQRGEPLRTDPAEGVAGEFVDPVVGDVIGRFAHRRKAGAGEF
jgi:hypothetical protein